MPAVQQRNVEGFSVEGYYRAEWRQNLIQSRQHSGFFGRFAHEELLQMKSSLLPPADPDHEGKCAGTSRQTAGFRVKEHKMLEGMLIEVRVTCPLANYLVIDPL